MIKSLGEKLSDAFDMIDGCKTPSYRTFAPATASHRERVALAFCASLSHEESAMEAIAELRDTVEGLTCDLRLAVETAYHRGATDWTRMNYPRIYAALTTKEG